MKKNYKKEIYKSRKEWLNARGIGGSDAAAILGKSKWVTLASVKKRLLGKKEIEEKKNSRMIEGTLKEPHIRKMYILNNSNIKVIEPPKRNCWLFRRKDYPLITCTPDGLIIKDNKKYGLEIKDVALYRKEQIDTWEDGILPEQYYIQMLHYLVTMEDLDGVIMYAHLMYYKKNEETGKWEYDYSVLRQYVVERTEVEKDIQILETKEIDFINKLKKE